MSERSIYKMGFRIILLLAIFISTVSVAFGQQSGPTNDTFVVPDKDHMQIVEMKDGSKLMGRIIEVRTEDIVFKSDIGDVTIQKGRIADIKLIPITSVKDGKYWFENPNTTRLYFAPTARMLKKGDGYFSDYYLFFPGIAYGISDNITIGGGMSLFPGLSLNEQIYYFTPKIGLRTTLHSSFAAGALIVALPKIDNEQHTTGIAYGVGTFGNGDGHLTVGLGYGFVDNHMAKKPMFMIGGEKRFSRRVSFVSENWIFPGVDEPIISYGLRFFGEGMSVDLALFNVLGEDTFFPGLPWVDFVVNF